jgi:hypothetical protein
MISLGTFPALMLEDMNLIPRLLSHKPGQPGSYPGQFSIGILTSVRCRDP